jgi:hypothetical protein
VEIEGVKMELRALSGKSLATDRLEHINPYGKYYFDLEKELGRNYYLRSLRHP